MYRIIERHFSNRFPIATLFPEMEAWLRKFLPTYITTDPIPAITGIRQVYSDYVKSVMRNFQLMENHVTSRNPTEIANFMSKFLGK
jgi:hypothetical protein